MNERKENFLALVEADLAGIEKALQENLNPYLDLVKETASHLLFSGGKRFRPLLMVLSARLCKYRGEDDKLFSTAFEFLHAATLLHDDLVDDASLRRGKPVAHTVYGAPTAVLVGDFLLSRALSIGVKSGRMKVIKVLAEVTEQMSQGEIHQLMRKGMLDLTEEEYMEMIHRKTALLIQAACRIGAVISDAAASEEEALSVYGWNIGMAFQMADDLLDYTADTVALGKMVGADLREGKLTLPVIQALKQANEADRAQMAVIIQDPAFSRAAFERLTQLLEAYGGIAYTREKAAGHVREAKRALGIFEPSTTRDMLTDLADYALTRKA